MATDLKGLRDFRRKITAFGSSSQNIERELVREVVDKGCDIARTEYADIDGVAVSGAYGNNTGQVIASGKEVAFIEFGTGRVGEGTYPETHLPTGTISFEDASGTMQSTSGWQYYYPSKYKRVSKKTGEEGWFHKPDGEKEAKFYTGQQAGMQMYRTAQRLKMACKAIIKNKINGGGGRV